MFNHEFNKLSVKINKELNLDCSCRHVHGKDFVIECFNDFNTILDKQEIKEKSIKEYFVLPYEYDNIISTSSDHSLSQI